MEETNVLGQFWLQFTVYLILTSSLQCMHDSNPLYSEVSLRNIRNLYPFTLQCIKKFGTWQYVMDY